MFILSARSRKLALLRTMVVVRHVVRQCIARWAGPLHPQDLRSSLEISVDGSIVGIFPGPSRLCVCSFYWPTMTPSKSCCPEKKRKLANGANVEELGGVMRCQVVDILLVDVESCICSIPDEATQGQHGESCKLENSSQARVEQVSGLIHAVWNGSGRLFGLIKSDLSQPSITREILLRCTNRRTLQLITTLGPDPLAYLALPQP
mmetsp:Transcript_15344/g.31123  ORF Transcript_15344/g.31123 Transcript_15344/m.31123 type:complete len:205 (-) Transcript_15344:424-1038(-)